MVVSDCNSGNISYDNDNRLYPPIPFEKHSFSRCSSAGSVHTHSSSTHDSGTSKI